MTKWEEEVYKRIKDNEGKKWTILTSNRMGKSYLRKMYKEYREKLKASTERSSCTVVKDG